MLRLTRRGTEKTGMGRRRDDDNARVFAVLVVGVVVTGAAGTAWRFVEQWWPLFALGGAVVLAGLVMLFRTRRARHRAAEARQRFLDTQVATTDAMTGSQFEALVARLLTRDGYTDVRVVGGSGDLGADVVAVDPAGRRLVVQCKRYAPHRGVSSPDMQKFLGTVWTEHGADLAWYVTTSGFSQPATALAGRQCVQLVARHQLAEWMAGADATSGASAAPHQVPARQTARTSPATRGSGALVRVAVGFLPFALAMGFLFDVAGARTSATALVTGYVTDGIDDMVEENQPPAPAAVPAPTP